MPALCEASRLERHMLDDERALRIDVPRELAVMAEANRFLRFGTSPRFYAVGTRLRLIGFGG
jgi:hypothetical protein